MGKAKEKQVIFVLMFVLFWNRKWTRSGLDPRPHVSLHGEDIHHGRRLASWVIYFGEPLSTWPGKGREPVGIN